MANFAVMGFGTVGSGVAEVLRMNGASIAEKLGEPLHLKYILDVRDLSATPYADIAVKDFSVLENDAELDVVVESIGGAKVALDFTRRALMAGKHVVTSNKELVASHGRELLAIAREKNVNYLFEASVGGGIPVLEQGFNLKGASAVIEKDLTAGLLAMEADADVLLIATSVPNVTLHYGTPEERPISRMSDEEAEAYIRQGHFEFASMLPKIEAAVSFLKAGKGRTAIITTLEKSIESIDGKAGTLISPKAL